MEPNVGGFDRTARLVVGAVLVVASAAAFLAEWELALFVGLMLLLAGALLLLTGTTRKCPVNRAAGIDTTK